MKWFSLPTWLLYLVFRARLPAKHPWKRRRFSLADWAAGATDLNHLFSFTFWCWLMFVIYFFVRFCKT